jgi:hypothetical protein
MRFFIIATLILTGLGCDDGDGSGSTLGETNLSQSDIRRAVTRYSACTGGELGEYIELVFEAHVLRGRSAEQLSAIVTCINGAADCDSARACGGLVPAECELGEERCDGTVVVSCREEAGRLFERRRDCADDPSGNTLCVDTGGFAFCSTGASCDDQPAERCEGDTLIYCFDDSAEQIDCTQTGRICRTIDDEARCVVREAADCQPCDGDIRQSCGDGFVRAQLDCSLVGLTCNPGDDAPCLAAEPACAEIDVRCTGDSAEFCFGGKWFSFDCGAYGSTCTMTEEGSVACQLAE